MALAGQQAGRQASARVGVAALAAGALFARSPPCSNISSAPANRGQCLHNYPIGAHLSATGGPDWPISGANSNKTPAAGDGQTGPRERATGKRAASQAAKVVLSFV